jgi:voltage-gated potassium channel
MLALWGGYTLQFTLSFVQVFALDLIDAAPILLTLVFTISIVGLRIAKIEGWTVIDGIYHALINATTVGYGDFRPTQTSSKIMSVGMALVGLIFTGLIVAIAVHAANIAFARKAAQTKSKTAFVGPNVIFSALMDTRSEIARDLIGLVPRNRNIPNGVARLAIQRLNSA